MEQILIGLAIGAIIAYFVFNKFNSAAKKSKHTSQSVILIEKIRAVCKLITVEGNFNEIYHYKNVEAKWMNKLLGTKKALVLIEAKAYVGFDLTKIKMESSETLKKITITNFPKPQLLSIETDFKYYDKREGWANPFTADDLTGINNEAKQHIIAKIPTSGLYEEASKQALETIHLIEELAATINWEVDYSSLKLPALKETKVLQSSNNTLA